MNIKYFAKIITIFFLSFLCANISYAGDKEKTKERKQERRQLSPNDIKAFIFQWYANIDHRRAKRDLLPYMTENVRITGRGIYKKSEFRKWYREYKKSVVKGKHYIQSIQVDGSEDQGWMVFVNYRWVAEFEDVEKGTLDEQYYEEWVLESKHRQIRIYQVNTLNNPPAIK
ncbi:hypothetical protein [Aureibacter tunicatorum]|uniref:SnoaL-like domain-containing protein n=1 Tax=Aureibacter tunicatorum TaxID=866807 RepID=A0AAE3XRS2_9BACT|nr:hypothetical protein [Aureibacter tunicatorum]MDR6241563.1 hypothetical protein [Aureibacter tunicatorum]BDD07213.1 hypothetical protein AUTU_46960 [Aureibacter tunicatorum]